ncbi:MAG: hypothetical protein ACO1RX_18350 [Candidatus Sericytochromatia bacterium]
MTTFLRFGLCAASFWLSLLLPLQAAPLPQLERARLEYGLAVVKRLDPFWPRAEKNPACLVLFGASGQWLMDCKTVIPGMEILPDALFEGQPIYWTPLALTLPHTRLPYAQIADKIVGQGLMYPAGQPALEPYRQQPWLLIQRQDDLRQHHPAFAETDTQEWLSLMVHELFHVLYQLPEAGIAAQLARASQPGDFVTQDPLKSLYRENQALRAALAREHRLLADALARDDLDAEAARQVLKAWLKLYHTRQALCKDCLAGQYRHWDAFWTFLEGTARYVESRLLLDAAWQPDLKLADADFDAFAATRGGGYADLPGANRAMGEAYYYAIGMHLGFLLDRIDEKWPYRVFAQPGWLVGLAESEALKK